MNDLEHDLREMLERRSHEGGVPSEPAPTMLERARRRQIGTVLTAVGGALALVAVSIVGILTLAQHEPPSRPGDQPQEVEDRTADGNVVNDAVPTGARIVIATGTYHQGGPWELYLEATSDGTALGLRFRDHLEVGGGSVCCLHPLEGDLRLARVGVDRPSSIFALASDAVTRVTFWTSSGASFDGDLYPVPDERLGIPQVALVLMPVGTLDEGELVAYDAEGNEVGRETLVIPHGPSS